MKFSNSAFEDDIFESRGDAMNEIELMGTLAALLTTGSFFPQVYRTVRSKSAKDLSSTWIIMMTVGVLLWVIYGIRINSTPVTVANIITFICLLIIGWVKFVKRTH